MSAANNKNINNSSGTPNKAPKTPSKKKSSTGLYTNANGDDEKTKAINKEEADLKRLREEIEKEKKLQEEMNLDNTELERAVEQLEKSVLELEAGNLAADDSEIKMRYDHQRQLNIQLQEQKRWLEHELEQIKLKIQTERQNPIPDPFSFDWDNLSDTEMKRLVGQLEKTRSDLNMQLHEAQGKLDKEGIDYHHFDDFYKDYKSQILNLNRTIDLLVRSGTIPASYVYELHAMHSEGSSFTSGASTGNHTPGGPSSGLNLGCSPKKSSSPPRKGSDQKALTSSPQKGRTPAGGAKKQPNHIPPAGRSGRGSRRSSGTPAGGGSGTATPKSSTGGLPINKLPPDNAGVRLPKLGKVDHQRPKKTEQQYSEEREVIRMMKEELYPTKKINELDTLNETENED